MKSDIDTLKIACISAVQSADSLDTLAEVEHRYFGRKNGELTHLLKSLKNLSVEDKKNFGPQLQELKENLTQEFQKKKNALLDQAESGAFLDITAPGTGVQKGHLHLVTQTISEIERIFRRLGFVRRRYPEVEWDHYAFEALNMPSGHPARDEWETFFITKAEKETDRSMVLTPHTSSGQVREMERGELPIRMINIAKCYRRQSDVSHTQMFHQFEGLLIDEHVSITHLKGVLDYFFKSFFGEHAKSRIRPYHFRFTEPSFEVDVTCALCKGSGCRYCKEGWSEIGGAGMVHPNVLKAGGIDPDTYSGFAFGWGVERVTLMRDGLNIDDLRTLYKNDIRFLRQF